MASTLSRRKRDIECFTTLSLAARLTKSHVSEHPKTEQGVLDHRTNVQGHQDQQHGSVYCQDTSRLEKKNSKAPQLLEYIM